MLELNVSSPPPRARRYGFNVFKDGKLVREQIVVAGSAAIAEVKVWRYLAADEYVWYVVPRLIGEDQLIVPPIDAATGEDDEPEVGEAA